MKYSLDEMEIRIKQECVGKLLSDSAIDNPANAICLFQNELKTLDREVMIVINLDVKNRPINYNVVSIGGADIAIVATANIFKSAILSNASSIMILHNHPSGDVTPSENDTNVTATIGEAGEVLNIPLYDSVIVGPVNDNYFSYRDKKPFVLKGISL